MKRQKEREKGEYTNKSTCMAVMWRGYQTEGLASAMDSMSMSPAFPPAIGMPGRKEKPSTYDGYYSDLD
jgi:hypothetical protein